MIVTTSRMPSDHQQRDAERIAAEFSLPLWDWSEYSHEIVDEALVVQRKRIVFVRGKSVLHYHPGMAMVRMKNLAKGVPDRLVSRAQLRHGDSFLDTTLGLGADSLVASFAVGVHGCVSGVESSVRVGVVVRDGLGRYPFPERFVAAARRIQVRIGCHREFLSTLPTNSWDVVYFDPMFAVPVKRSQSLRNLRQFADERAISPEAVQEARRVARRFVILKERRRSPLFACLGFGIPGGNNPIEFGVIEADASS